ncbi:E3 ubiquitin-protein ligase RNF13 isoform X2 [Manduca sexta]|uniref:E3 ubiquitin-protein ligase RNF13 isoform X2 n=1 Tax=Manduca sexta TaxID=7130 RepID=UPI00188E4E26|nr:E3 ubiquitin-protein ligase RNF13 isoform X2 [Manduca sexta]XP_037300800.1 E3 ubiquitin-protein ligase RNF13 isoform X2 [Manduca sexta]
MAAQLAINAIRVMYIVGMQHFIMQEFLDIPASFGGDLPPEGLRGLLVAGEPADGCSALVKPPVVDNFTGKWIVLVARYNCSFEIKVRNAQLAGYDCAIVHNVNSSDLETMSAKDPAGIIIPSVFVSDLTGYLLGDEYLYNQGFYIMVNDDLPFNINTHLLLPFAVVVVLCLLAILIFLIVKCIKDRRRARRHRLPPRSLAKIPTCKFSKGDPYDTCAICLDDYKEGERLRVLPCAHAYHAVCIDPWLTQNKRVCPVCKRRVLAAGERRVTTHSNSDSDSDTEPLLPEPTRPQPTQGGTFEEQRENPFTRAARFMARLRRERPQENAEEPSTQSEEHEAPEENTSSDRQPLVRAVSERRARRARSRASPAHAQATAPASAAPAPAPAPPAPAPAPPAPAPVAHAPAALAPDVASINSQREPDTGDIGVAALPASEATSQHVNL